MPLTIPYNNFIPGTTIFSSQVNTNNQSIANWANDHEIATVGVHGVLTGSIVGTDNVNFFTNINSFDNLTVVQAFDPHSPEWISASGLYLASGVLTLNPAFAGYPVPAPEKKVVIVNPNTDSGLISSIFQSGDYCTVQDATSISSYFYNGSIGTEWGTSSGAWTEPLPLFIYIATNPGTNIPCLFFSRCPNLKYIPSDVTYIGYAGHPPTFNSATAVVAWTANNVRLTHAGRPCRYVGYVQATKNGLGDWTILNLTGTPVATAGWGDHSYEKIWFNMPQGQNGSALNSWFGVGGPDTAPTYTAGSHVYRILRNGVILGKIQVHNTTGATPGAGTNPLFFGVPFYEYLTSRMTGGITGSGFLYNGVFVEVLVDSMNFTGPFPVLEGGPYLKYNYALATGTAGMRSRAIAADDQNQAIRQILVNYTINISQN